MAWVGILTGPRPRCLIVGKAFSLPVLSHKVGLMVTRLGRYECQINNTPKMSHLVMILPCLEKAAPSNNDKGI